MINKKIWLIDVDGTLSENNVDYYTFIKTSPKNYDAYFKGLIHIKPITQVVEWVKKLREDKNNFLIIFTARSEENREVTEKWLNHYGIEYDTMVMRDSKDFRPDYIAKGDMLKDVRNTYGEPYAALEDRIANIRMFAENGVFTFNVSQGIDY